MYHIILFYIFEYMIFNINLKIFLYLEFINSINHMLPLKYDCKWNSSFHISI